MIQYREAVSILRESALSRALPTERVDLERSMGRIVSEEVRSREDVPSFDNSAMDGFAVLAGLTAGASPENPLTLRVASTVAAGDRPAHFTEQVAIEIMTGAPMPTGPFDAVAKVEDVRVARGEITLTQPVRPGENVRLKGTDYCVGQGLLKPGMRLHPEHMMALASLGVAEVPVRRRPRVAVISTGRELVSYSAPSLEPGKIRNSTGPFLTAALASCGADARYWGVVEDEPVRFVELMRRILNERPDIVISTGAVSMGKYDFVRPALESMDARILFHKCAIRPGKPLLFAELREGPVFFGVPGNPVSTAVGLRFFVDAYLRAVLGLPEEAPRWGRLAAGTTKPEGFRCFFKAQVESNESGSKVKALKGQESYRVSPLLSANAWVVFPESGSSMKEGESVAVLPLHHSLGREMF